MGFGAKLSQLWQSYFTVISMSVYSFVLVVVEHSMDLDFKCPEESILRYFYAIFYIVIPPTVLFLLVVVFQPACIHPPSKTEISRCKRCAKCWGKTLIPAVAWIIIMLLDGKYVDCAHGNGLASVSQLKSRAYYISQIVGLWLLLILVGIVCYLYRDKPTQRISMDAERCEMMLKDQAEEYLKKQQKEAIKQLIEKHQNKHYIVAPGTFIMGLTEDQITAKIEEGFNAVEGAQAPAARNGNSDGRNSAGHPEIQSRNGQEPEEKEMKHMIS